VLSFSRRQPGWIGGRKKEEKEVTLRYLGVLTAGLLAGANAWSQVYLPPPGQAAQKKADQLARYWTADGRLQAPLEVRDEKKAFGTFAGLVYHIEPNGAWTITRIFRNRPQVEAQGVLDKKELKKLAEALARYDALTLPSAGQPQLNPHVLTVQFGEHTAFLALGIDQVAAPAPPDSPAPGVIGRFGGIAAAVRRALRVPEPRGIPVGDAP
jgi:hypothetical protein